MATLTASLGQSPSTDWSPRSGRPQRRLAWMRGSWRAGRAGTWAGEPRAWPEDELQQGVSGRREDWSASRYRAKRSCRQVPGRGRLPVERTTTLTVAQREWLGGRIGGDTGPGPLA
jgi:hypothetical protein